MRDFFDKTASYYSKYRLKPPSEVVEELKKIGELNGQEKLLDVGCGPGTSTFLLSPFFKDIIALDSSYSMIQEGIRQASKLAISNISWICSTAESVDLDLIGKVDIIIFANSFHWMDQNLVLDRFYNSVSKGGAFLGLSSSWNKQEKHDQIIISTIQEFIGETRKTVRGTYKEPKNTFHEVLENSPFTYIERKLLPFKHEYTVKELIGLQLSTSYANENLLGTRKEEFIKVLGEKLQNISQDGKIMSDEVYEVILFSK